MIPDIDTSIEKDEVSRFSDVRQGSVLSPFLLNIYVNDLIVFVLLESSGLGCGIGNNLLGCIMHADNLLLISAFVSGLQSMPAICYDFAQRHLMTFNSLKSRCCHFKPNSVNVSAIKLTGEYI